MNLLFVTSRPPWPGRRGDQARVGGLARVLGRRHAVRVVALRPPGFAVDTPPDDLLLDTVPLGRPAMLAGLGRGLGGFLAGRRPLQAALFDQPALRRTVRDVVDDWRPDAVVVTLSRLADVLPAVEGRPVILDLVDALGLNMRRRAERGGPLAALWSAEARRLDAWDASAVARVERATVVAERDRLAIVDGAPPALRATIEERLKVVPFGLDLDPGDCSTAAGDGPPTLITSGNLGYFPTVEGVRWFAAEIWPRIRARRGDVRWRLAGARPAPVIRRLAGRPGVDLVADPDELRVLVRAADVAVVPLRAGSGTPIKILEAMADGVPVVTTPGGVAGLDRLPGDAVDTVEEPAAFADAVLRLLDEPELAAQRARSARAWLERHRLETTAEAFEAVIEEAITAGRRPARR